MDTKKMKEVINELSELEESKEKFLVLMNKLMHNDAQINEIIFSSHFEGDGEEEDKGNVEYPDYTIPPLPMQWMMDAMNDGMRLPSDVVMEVTNREMLEMIGIMLRTLTIKINVAQKKLRTK